MDATEIRVHGLTRLDKLALGGQGNDVSFLEEKLDSSKSGEPVTILAIVALTSAGITALAAWALKNREVTEFSRHVTVRNKDGSSYEVDVHIKINKSTTEADVVREIGKQLKIPLDSFVVS